MVRYIFYISCRPFFDNINCSLATTKAIKFDFKIIIFFHLLRWFYPVWAVCRFICTEVAQFVFDHSFLKSSEILQLWLPFLWGRTSWMVGTKSFFKLKRYISLWSCLLIWTSHISIITIAKTLLNSIRIIATDPVLQILSLSTIIFLFLNTLQTLLQTWRCRFRLDGDIFRIPYYTVDHLSSLKTPLMFGCIPHFIIFGHVRFKRGYRLLLSADFDDTSEMRRYTIINLFFIVIACLVYMLRVVQKSSFSRIRSLRCKYTLAHWFGFLLFWSRFAKLINHIVILCF